MDNNDFKYVIQDTGHVYFGKELTLQEIMDMEDVPFKFKAIISAYVSKDTALDVKFSEHVLTVDKENFSYRIYKQLKLQVRFFYAEDKKGLGSKVKRKWVHRTCTFEELQERYREAIRTQEAQIEEISISKLALMAISI